MIEKLIGPITGLLDKFIEDKDQKNVLWRMKLQQCRKNMRKKLLKARWLSI